MSVRTTTILVLALLLAAFVALYPQLGAAGMCDSGECPQIASPASSGSSGSSSGICCPALAVAAVAPVVGAAALGLRVRGASMVRPPYRIYFSPESPPPRLYL